MKKFNQQHKSKEKKWSSKKSTKNTNKFKTKNQSQFSKDMKWRNYSFKIQIRHLLRNFNYKSSNSMRKIAQNQVLLHSNNRKWNNFRRNLQSLKKNPLVKARN